MVRRMVRQAGSVAVAGSALCSLGEVGDVRTQPVGQPTLDDALAHAAS